MYEAEGRVFLSQRSTRTPVQSEDTKIPDEIRKCMLR
jgi:hypothetical protein